MNRGFCNLVLAGFCYLLINLATLGSSQNIPPGKKEKTGCLKAGFAVVEITPPVGDKPVFIAGFGHNRRATGVHDPLQARAMVLEDCDRKIALVCLDVIGLFHDTVDRVRNQLPGFHYILVSSTHNHEGPDTMGLWGPGLFSSGVDPVYQKFLEGQVVKAIHQADENAQLVTPRLGTARSPELLHDGREPYIKHDELVAIDFQDPRTKKTVGLVVQWNCHPETLEGKNTLISSDFVGATVRTLGERHHCPVVYFSGTVGGMMTSLHVEVKDEQGHVLPEGSFEKTECYGRLVGRLADKALEEGKPVSLTPLSAHTREVFIPLDNKLYQFARKMGVFERQAFIWNSDPDHAELAKPHQDDKPLCLKTEVAWLRLGELDVAGIPGEIYPELVLDKVQDPVDPGADFPHAPIEPAIYKQLQGPHRMIIGLANDELGYIIPKRQWDKKPPFCYGRKEAQYGEANSVGPDTAPILCQAFKELTEGKK